METTDLSQYLNVNFPKVEGWCIPQLWQCIQPLALEIEALGAKGPIAEIGVYHGKFFLGLVKTMSWDRDNTAFDVFDMQNFNLDKAGEGNKEKLLKNIAMSGVNSDAVFLHRTDSMWLKPDDAAKLRAKVGGFSLFSVDGCHLPEHTINDILFAMQVTKPEGIIFVDDYYNANWPGVQEGVAKLYLNSTAQYVPLLFTCNKLFLCNLSFHDRYLRSARDFLKKHFPSTRVKAVRRFGFDTLTVVPDMREGKYLAD